MTMTKTFTAIAIATSIFAGATSVALAGPVQSVSVAKEGIDVVPIEVVATGSKYNKIKTHSHKFGLKLYAKAAWGKKIKKAKVASGSAVIGEYTAKWDKTYSHNSRTFSKSLQPNIKISEVTFSGNNPIQACNAKLASHRNALTTGASATVSAYFQISATTKLYKNSPIAKNETKSWVWYPVNVKCLPKGIVGGFTN
jgi:hypothetical protein